MFRVSRDSFRDDDPSFSMFDLAIAEARDRSNNGQVFYVTEFAPSARVCGRARRGMWYRICPKCNSVSLPDAAACMKCNGDGYIP